MIGLGNKKRCLNPACGKILNGRTKKMFGDYCTFHCKDVVAQGSTTPEVVEVEQPSTYTRIKSAAKSEAKAKKKKKGAKSKRKMCKGVDVALFIAELKKLCESENASLYPLGKRSAFYELYNRGVVPEFSKDKFQYFYKHINDACESGELDDAWFVDTSRKLSHSSGDEGVADALFSRLNVTELDHWKDQPVVPIIMCEKDGHQGILARVSSARQVRLFTSKGTWSRPSLIRVADAVEAVVKQGKRVVIGYVGDHDPAGMFRIERTAFEGNFTGQNESRGLRQHLEKRGIEEGWTWERVALTTEQFRMLDENVLGDVYEKDEEEGTVKRVDACNVEYVQAFGTKRADVEALGFDGMREEVKNFIERHTNNELWEESERQSRLEVIRGKALLSLYTRDSDTPFSEEFEAIYSGFLSGGMSEREAVAETRDFFEQRDEVTSQLIVQMQNTVTKDRDLLTLLEEKEAALEKETEELWSPAETTCVHCGEGVVYDGQFWTHSVDNVDSLLCPDGSGEKATPAE